MIFNTSDFRESPLMLGLAALVISFVVLESVFFLVKAWKRGKAIGMSTETLKNAVFTSSLFSVAPAISILVTVFTLSSALGVVLPWVRLSVIGNLLYESSAAKTTLEVFGLDLSRAVEDKAAFAAVAWVMTLGICFGLILVTIFGRLIIKKHIDVAMPIFMDGGITFPVKVRAIEDKSLRQLADQISDIMSRLDKTDVDGLLFDLIQQRMLGFMLKGKVVSTFAQIASGFVGKYSVTSAADIFKKRTKDPESLSMYDFNEGTVCFTNTGTLCRELYGHISYGPLLYPQVFMLGISNIKDVDYAFKNEDGVVDIATKKMLPITLAFDHRLGGFGDVIPLVKKFEEVFANPEIIHEW